jgi:hypothetical protein
MIAWCLLEVELWLLVGVVVCCRWVEVVSVVLVWVWQVMVPCVGGDVAFSEKPAFQVSW